MGRRADPRRTAPAVRAALIVSTSAVAALSVGVTDAVAQLQGPEVTSVEFEGNETFPSDSLSRAIVTRETECRSWVFRFVVPFCPLGIDFALRRSELRNRDLPRDRARLILWYRLRGFREVQVDTPRVEQTPTQARVIFRVTEGRPVIAESIEFLGAEPFMDTGLLDDLPIERGDRLSTIALDATRDTITRRLGNEGYAYAGVFRTAFRPSDDPYNAEVSFEILPGPRSVYGDVGVDGLQNLGVGTVLRTAQITTGETYRLDDIDEARARLFGLEIVRSATVVPDTAAAVQDSIIDVDITVQEGDAYRVRAGGGWTTAECLNLEARWASRNFFGGGRLLQVRGRVGNLLASEFRDVLCTQSGQGRFARLTGLGAVDFVQPWIFSTRNSLTISLFAERQSLPDIFIRRAIGTQIALSRSISPQTVLTGFFRPELSELDADDVLFCTGFLVCTPRDISRLEGANWLSPVGLNLTRDRSDDLLNPRRGYRLLFDVEHAAPWTASDFRYDRIVAEATRYASLGGLVFAGRLRGGWVAGGGFEGISSGGAVDIVPPQKRYYTGGANSVRGFAQSRLGPRVLVAEPEPLLSQLERGGGCAPTDLADLTCDPNADARLDPQPTGGTRVLEANAEFRFPIARFLEGVLFTDVGQAWGQGQVVNLDQLEFTPGAGIRFPSPVGPIRVDVAYRFQGAEDLRVVTEQIRPYVMGSDEESDQLLVDESRIPWVSTGELVFLESPFRFGENGRGLQFHVSIGQAF